jgi:hypothetical protein
LKSGPDFLNTQQPFAFHHAIAAASKDLLPKTKKKQNSITEKNFIPDDGFKRCTALKPPQYYYYYYYYTPLTTSTTTTTPGEILSWNS